MRKPAARRERESSSDEPGAVWATALDAERGQQRVRNKAGEEELRFDSRVDRLRRRRSRAPRSRTPVASRLAAAKPSG